MQNSLELRVRKTIQQFGMLSGGEHVLVAVSGGPDSVALLVCLHKLAPELSLTLTVAHLNHGIRGTEAVADEEFVRRLSSGLNLPYLSESVNIKGLAESEKRNLEELAREKRYEFLKQTARKTGAGKIAVGHTLSDQAETALFRFIRGSGIEGLSAIHPVIHGIVIRPLIECPRKSILEYLEFKKIDYREDSTNKNLRYSRNRLRHVVIPILEQHFNPQLIPTLAREASLARETWSFVESHAKDLFAEVHSRKGDAISLKLNDIGKLHPVMQKEVVRLAIRECLGSLRGIGGVHIANILSLLNSDQSGAMIQLPHGGTVLRQFGEILILKIPFLEETAFKYVLKIPGSCSVPEAQAQFSATLCPTPDLQTMRTTCSSQAFFEATSLPDQLVIRSRKPGDRYGGQEHRKVKKMLIDGKIPVSMRSSLPMVVYGDKVIWVPGFRPARGFEAKSDSISCICIQMGERE
jgi:tRNA(Ile)-lysidine synthase